MTAEGARWEIDGMRDGIGRPRVVDVHTADEAGRVDVVILSGDHAIRLSNHGLAVKLCDAISAADRVAERRRRSM